ncbi:hypothetical protein C8R44DRAFT_746474 [Mycena epipterygia]|nr:hypothetical protein C8R44DRAFT_746474 [Mycena epipterygia]
MPGWGEGSGGGRQAAEGLEWCKQKKILFGLLGMGRNGAAAGHCNQQRSGESSGDGRQAVVPASSSGGAGMEQAKIFNWAPPDFVKKTGQDQNPSSIVGDFPASIGLLVATTVRIGAKFPVWELGKTRAEIDS